MIISGVFRPVTGVPIREEGWIIIDKGIIKARSFYLKGVMRRVMFVGSLIRPDPVIQAAFVAADRLRAPRKEIDGRDAVKLEIIFPGLNAPVFLAA